MTAEEAGERIDTILKENRKLDKLERHEIREQFREICESIRTEEEEPESAGEEAIRGFCPIGGARAEAMSLIHEYDLGVILQFLYIIRKLTLGEFTGLCDLANGIAKEAGRKRRRNRDEGKVLITEGRG